MDPSDRTESKNGEEVDQWQRILSSQGECDHENLVEHDLGDTRVRCCSQCGLIQLDPRSPRKLLPEEAQSIRRKTGFSEEEIEEIATGGGDINRLLTRESLYVRSVGAVLFALAAFSILYFSKWDFVTEEELGKSVVLGLIVLIVTICTPSNPRAASGLNFVLVKPISINFDIEG